ncbi:thiamine ABC transporter substrate binding subunit [Rhodalgimonas zhirmunskyi]|uniref:Thiamine-binding periplasmic protein n=1 Tax=Rhodalgimonas zhirmunskyi TaxID=2964767 RepID=A0AAJ1U6T6_9RHOB|nr:thiamine ABC transporter substrate binding subunit [Rhodoalgimonas zhirmunskyi]MDQ2094079.1 thiamine ABC transporter substrate binding subunit [Rhodoalgimonas zhirmunskyi]
MRHLAFAAGIFLAGQALAETPVLKVYTYDSFVSDWGPGPVIEKRFEEVCDCDLQFVGAGDGAALLARLKLEGKRTDADVVLGLDTSLTAQAAETGLFAPHGKTPKVDVPTPYEEAGAWSDPLFLPYDYGYLAFVYDKTKLSEAPKTFEELAASDVKIVIQDPRSSTPGLGLLLWVKAQYGDQAEAMWGTLSDNIVTVTPGWSEAYGLFLEGEADMVLSYTTSPAYHRIAEKDDSKAAAVFEQGNYMQIEVAGKLAGTDQPELADRFLDFMLSDAFQSAIPELNWMYPAVTPKDGLPSGFDAPLISDHAVLIEPAKVPAMRAEALSEWQTALSR